ncbi:MAG: GDP-mannose-dependent monoacylated alpha-(1-6)-phosphatidylinositol monomannoside mannosyltransferase [Syntrophomonadaceae bacterium]|nr:GDP-mannose-dependent monoacylated alpha-(1-6)-phosphatidylinositol monomannoside mannosyltransferase [Bacillota bacterium]
MAVYLDHDLTSRSIIILDQHNADELVWRKYAQESDNIAMRLFATLNLKRLRKFQREVANLLNVVVSVSEEDASFMRNQLPADIAVWTVPNGVDINYFQPLNPNDKKANVLMLCASMETIMNIDAALRFAKEVLPLVKKKMPASEFWIVGKDPVKPIRNLAKRDDIKVTGTVEDVRPYYEKAKVFVAPFRFGGGTKLKILEAMAMEVPVVSTSHGCQGINAIDGMHLLIRDNIEEFAEAVIKLLEDEKERNKLINNGRRLVEERYSWSSIVETLEPKLMKLVNERGLSKGERFSHLPQDGLVNTEDLGREI